MILKEPNNPNCIFPCKSRSWKEIESHHFFIIKGQHTIAITLVNFLLHLMISWISDKVEQVWIKNHLAVARWFLRIHCQENLVAPKWCLKVNCQECLVVTRQFPTYIVESQSFWNLQLFKKNCGLGIITDSMKGFGFLIGSRGGPQHKPWSLRTLQQVWDCWYVGQWFCLHVQGVQDFK